MGRRKNFLEEAVNSLKLNGIDADYATGDVRDAKVAEMVQHGFFFSIIISLFSF